MSASISEGVSYIQSLLPPLDLPEGIQIDIETRLGGRNCTTERLGSNLQLIKLFLKITEDAAKALQGAEFKRFDALVRNFGCQITAHQVFQIVQSKSLFEEAQTVMTVADSKLKAVEAARSSAGLILKQKFKGKDFSFREIVNTLDLNFPVTPEFSRLIRLRALSIVNLSTVTLKNGRKIETPKTNLDALQRLLRGKQIKCLPILVSGLQADESLQAVFHIQEIAKGLPDSLERKKLLERAAATDRVRKSNPQKIPSSPILSLPLLHNTEISIRGITSGVILVKNKLFIGNEAIENAEDIKFFLDAATFLPLTSERKDALSETTPLLVIEGYIFDQNRLAGILEEGGLIRILNANCAVLTQYASKTSQEVIEDSIVQEDIVQYAKEKEIPQKIFEVDHLFCSSVGSER